MCDEDVDDCLVALKVVTDWFVTSKAIKKLFTPLYVIDNILYFDTNSGNATFCCNEMHCMKNNIFVKMLNVIFAHILVIFRIWWKYHIFCKTKIEEIIIFSIISDIFRNKSIMTKKKEKD